jgi:alkaline phosphatase D
MTHAYTNFTSEENPTRTGEVISEKSFGILNFDLENEVVNLQMVGQDGNILQEINQSFKSKQ